MGSLVTQKIFVNRINLVLDLRDFKTESKKLNSARSFQLFLLVKSLNRLLFQATLNRNTEF